MKSILQELIQFLKRDLSDYSVADFSKLSKATRLFLLLWLGILFFVVFRVSWSFFYVSKTHDLLQKEQIKITQKLLKQTEINHAFNSLFSLEQYHQLEKLVPLIPANSPENPYQAITDIVKKVGMHLISVQPFEKSVQLTQQTGQKNYTSASSLMVLFEEVDSGNLANKIEPRSIFQRTELDLFLCGNYSQILIFLEEASQHFSADLLELVLLEEISHKGSDARCDRVNFHLTLFLYPKRDLLNSLVDLFKTSLSDSTLITRLENLHHFIRSDYYSYLEKRVNQGNTHPSRLTASMRSFENLFKIPAVNNSASYYKNRANNLIDARAINIRGKLEDAHQNYFFIMEDELGNLSLKLMELEGD